MQIKQGLYNQNDKFEFNFITQPYILNENKKFMYSNNDVTFFKIFNHKKCNLLIKELER